MSHLYILVITICVCASFSIAQAPMSTGKYTKEIRSPKTAHIQHASDVGKVRRIRGKLYCCKEGIPVGAIISVYRVADGKERFLFSYLVGADGRFDFRGLRKGEYLLKTGTVDGYFNSDYVTVRLAPEDKDSSADDIEIGLEVGT